MINENQINLEDIKPVEGVSVDLNKYDKKEVTIENAEVMQVKSKFVETKEGLQWVLKISSKVLEEFGEGDDLIQFRASELFNLIQDEDGNLKGFPTGEASNLMQFLMDLKIDQPQGLESLRAVVDAVVGAKTLVKSYDKDVDGNKRTYLKFRY